MSFLVDVSASSSAVLVNREFQISYVDGSSSTGDYINETFAIGDVKLTNMQMGLGLQTDIAYGLVGVGYDLNEASQELYANLPIMMVNEGFINSIAYSLWLNDLGASTGNILFGGIDTDKYTGDLISVDVQPAAQDEFTSFTVLLTSVEGHSSSGEDALSSSSFPIPVVLDSGTTFSYLPDDLALQVWTEVGAEYMVVSNDGTGAPLVPCALANNNGYVAFGFGGTGGPVIKVGMDELVSPIFTSDVKFTSGTYKGESICQFGIQNLTVTNSEGTPHFLLGDTFLRSAYVVYDLENNQIGLANTDFNATSSNVVPFPSAGAAIPSASAAPSQTDVNSGPTSSPAYNARAGFTDLSSTGSSSGSSGSGSGGNSSGGDDNAGSLAPALDFTQLIVMGASMGLMMFGGGMFLLF